MATALLCCVLHYHMPAIGPINSSAPTSIKPLPPSCQAGPSLCPAFQAIELFRISTLDAAKSGVAEGYAPNQSQIEEIKGVEAHIRRRVAIGSTVSERKLVDELQRIGMSDTLVRRALAYMATRGDVEYRRERKLIKRLS